MKPTIFFWIMLILIIISGCAKVQYGDMKYERLGNQNLTGFYVEKTEPNGVILKAGFDTQQSQNDEFAKRIADGVVQGLTPFFVPVP